MALWPPQYFPKITNTLKELDDQLDGDQRLIISISYQFFNERMKVLLYGDLAFKEIEEKDLPDHQHLDGILKMFSVSSGREIHVLEGYKLWRNAMVFATSEYLQVFN